MEGSGRMSKSNAVSMAVVRRLPKYYRYLSELLEHDVRRISSKELSRLTGFTASQIRQDLNNFGGFGQQGYGYNVEDLKTEIGKILGLQTEHRIIVIGAGNMGHAITNFRGFEHSGFKVVALFDKSPEMIGTFIRGVEVLNIDLIEQYIEEHKVDIGAICTPREGAQEIADRLMRCKVKGIWNFAPVDLDVPDEMVIENVHLNESLFTLSYLIHEKKKNKDSKKRM